MSPLLLLMACGQDTTIDVEIREADDGGLSCEATVSDGEKGEAEVRYAWSDGHEGATLSPEHASRRATWTCTVTVESGWRDPSASATWTADGPLAGMYAWVKLTDLLGPCDMVATPDGRLVIASLKGFLYLVDPADPAAAEEIQLGDGTAGLLSLALDPRFGDGDHDWIYLWRDGDPALTRAKLDLDPFALGAQQPVFAPDCESGEVHCTGDLLFWDGEGETLLYLTSGQAAGTDHADPDNLGSKLIALRIDDETGEGSAAFSEGPVVATGLRNPWRLADCGAGLCIADPGDTSAEEINLYTTHGQDFGWPDAEGPGDGAGEDPIAWWADDDDSYAEADTLSPGEPRFLRAPALGHRLSGDVLGGRLDGWALYGDFFDGWTGALEISAEGEVGRTVIIGHQPYLSTTVEAGGEVYGADLAGGLYQLVHWADRPVVSEDWLSETRYDEATPFDVRYALWSNGAEKHRSIWLPEGKHIDTTQVPWTFPNGAQLFKTFVVDGQPVETRLLTRVDGRWLGATYAWDGEDAARTDGRRAEVSTAEGGTWTLPAETSCADCHDGTRGRAWPLGLEPFTLGDEGLDQISALLDSPPDPAPEVEGSALDAAARGLLHVNCAFCHNPSGQAPWTNGPSFDLSYDAELDLVGVLTESWGVAHDEASTWLVVNPDDPEDSALTAVMESTEMPYVGVWEPDEDGIATLHAWIATLEGAE